MSGICFYEENLAESYWGVKISANKVFFYGVCYSLSDVAQGSKLSKRKVDNLRLFLVSISEKENSLISPLILVLFLILGSSSSNWV